MKSRTGIGRIIFCYLLAFIAPGSFTFAQKTKTKIQRIALDKGAVSECVRQFIKEQRDSNALFKAGYGYLQLSSVKTGNFAPVNTADGSAAIEDAFAQTALSFSTGLTSMVLTKPKESHGGPNDYYPPYYACVEGVLVLVHDAIFHALTASPRHPFGFDSPFDEKSKRKLRQLMFPYLKKALEEDFVFRGLDGEVFTVSKAERKKLSNTEILQRAAFTQGVGKKYRITRAGKIFGQSL